MPKQVEERTFIVEYKGDVVKIITDDTKVGAFNAILKSIFVAYRTQPKKLDAFMKLINAYHAVVKEKGRLQFQEDYEDDSLSLDDLTPQQQLDPSAKKNLLCLLDQYRMFKFLSEANSITTEQREIIQKVEQTVELLPTEEKELIQLRYLPLEAEYVKDSAIYEQLGISAGTYNKRRHKAFLKLILALGLNQQPQNEKDDAK